MAVGAATALGVAKVLATSRRVIKVARKLTVVKKAGKAITGGKSLCKRIASSAARHAGVRNSRIGGLIRNDKPLTSFRTAEAKTAFPRFSGRLGKLRTRLRDDSSRIAARTGKVASGARRKITAQAKGTLKKIQKRDIQDDLHTLHKIAKRARSIQKHMSQVRGALNNLPSLGNPPSPAAVRSVGNAEVELSSLSSSFENWCTECDAAITEVDAWEAQHGVSANSAESTGSSESGDSDCAATPREELYVISGSADKWASEWVLAVVDGCRAVLEQVNACHAAAANQSPELEAIVQEASEEIVNLAIEWQEQREEESAA